MNIIDLDDASVEQTANLGNGMCIAEPKQCQQVSVVVPEKSILQQPTMCDIRQQNELLIQAQLQLAIAPNLGRKISSLPAFLTNQLSNAILPSFTATSAVAARTPTVTGGYITKHTTRSSSSTDSGLDQEINVVSGNISAKQVKEQIGLLKNGPCFCCDICGKGFSQQRMLNRHRKNHSPVKKYHCTFCSKGFNDSFDLKRHIRTHTGVKPYKCSACEKSFTQRCSLESHMDKIHGLRHKFTYKERRAKLYVCEDCGYSTSEVRDYYAHGREAHPHKTSQSASLFLDTSTLQADAASALSRLFSSNASTSWMH